MSSKTIRIKNNGGIEALKKRVKKSGTVDVGIIDAGNHPSGNMTVAEIGFVHEFGSEKAGIPERSFIRSTIQDQKKNIIKLQKKLLSKLQKGEISSDQGLGLLGEFMADKIKMKIVSIRVPPNAESTISRKGSSNPLIDTGQLKNSITYKVNNE